LCKSNVDLIADLNEINNVMYHQIITDFLFIFF
jgi:hypothetical protein